MKAVSARCLSGEADRSPESFAPLTRYAILRCLRDLILAEGSKQTATVPDLERRLFGPNVTCETLAAMAVAEDGIGLDSLGRISVATSVARFFDLGASGIDDHLLHAERLGDWADLIVHHVRVMPSVSWPITFATSGSTDTPRNVAHPLSILLAEVQATAREIVQPPPERVVALVPAHHIYGFLFTCLYPAAEGIGVLDLHRRAPTAALRHLSAGDLVVGTPQDWLHLSGATELFTPGVRGIVSAGPMPDGLYKRLSEQGLDELIEVYGATETAGLGWRRSQEQAFRPMPHLFRSGTNLQRKASKTPLDVPDRLIWQGKDRFILGGRCDRVVQVAGVNVSLARVRRVLESVHGVAAAAVRPGPERLKAFVVPATHDADIGLLRAQIRTTLEAELAAPARPASIVFGPDLPRNAMGKPGDWDVAMDHFPEM